MEIVYLIEEGETTGPFDPREVRDRLLDEDLDPNTYAFIKGMPDWRTVAETLVWAEARAMRLSARDIKQAVMDCLRGKIDPATARLNVVERLRKRGYWPTPEEITTVGMIVELNVSARAGRDQCLQGREDGVIDAFPVQEAFTLTQPVFARDWEAEWLKAGGRLYGGRFIARKDDPVWLAFGDFGLGHPPFGTDGCLWTRDITREEALELGVESEGERMAPLVLPDGPGFLLTANWMRTPSA